MSRYTYTTKEGLKCVFIKREGFVESYAGIGFHFGGAHTEYVINGEHKYLKSGLAHFLEHKAFIMADGKDGLEVLEAMNASSNAYTSYEQTLYYFETSDSIFNPLKTLIQMIFEVGFDEESVEKEKSIILAEKRDSFDVVDRRINYEWKYILYPEDSYSYDILGSEEDIKNITYQDLLEAFHTFYRPDNAILVVVGDYDAGEIFKTIEDAMKSFSFAKDKIERISFIQSKEVLPEKIIEEEIPYPELHIVGRIDEINYDDAMFTDRSIALLDNLFSVKAPFYKELSKAGYLILDDIEYSVASNEFGCYYEISIYTDAPEELYSIIKEKLKSFTELDYSSDISLKTMKIYLCDYIRALDSISYIGDETITLALEGKDYEDNYQYIKNTTDEDIKKYIPYFRNSKISAVLVYPKNNE